MRVSEALGLVVSVVTFGYVSAVSYSFDATTAKQCGESTLLPKDQSVNIQAKGKVPGGYCGVAVYAINDMPNCSYPAICADVTGAMMSSCKAKVYFTGIYFNQRKEHTKELSCTSPMSTQFCTQGDVMRVEVIEESTYAQVTSGKMEYKFNATITRKCMMKKEPAYVEYAEDDYKAPDLEDARYRNYVIGLVVACALACVFLIILIVMKCYYKSQPYSGLKQDK